MSLERKPRIVMNASKLIPFTIVEHNYMKRKRRKQLQEKILNQKQSLEGGNKDDNEIQTKIQHRNIYSNEDTGIRRQLFRTPQNLVRSENNDHFKSENRSENRRKTPQMLISKLPPSLREKILNGEFENEVISQLQQNVALKNREIMQVKQELEHTLAMLDEMENINRSFTNEQISANRKSTFLQLQQKVAQLKEREELDELSATQKHNQKREKNKNAENNDMDMNMNYNNNDYYFNDQQIAEYSVSDSKEMNYNVEEIPSFDYQQSTQAKENRNHRKIISQSTIGTQTIAQKSKKMKSLKMEMDNIKYAQPKLWQTEELNNNPMNGFEQNFINNTTTIVTDLQQALDIVEKENQTLKNILRTERKQFNDQIIRITRNMQNMSQELLSLKQRNICIDHCIQTDQILKPDMLYAQSYLKNYSTPNVAKMPVIIDMQAADGRRILTVNESHPSLDLCEKHSNRISAALSFSPLEHYSSLMKLSDSPSSVHAHNSHNKSVASSKKFNSSSSKKRVKKSNQRKSKKSKAVSKSKRRSSRNSRKSRAVIYNHAPSIDTEEAMFSSSDDNDNIFSYFRNSNRSSKTKQVTEERIQKVFKKFDTDQSAVLSYDQFVQCVNYLGLNHLNIKQVWEEVNVDGSGYLDYSEFRQAILGPQKTKKLNIHQLFAVFNKLDADNSGELDLEEFKRACKYLGFAQHSADDHNFVKYFAKVDIDHSGFIDFNEFAIALLGSVPSKQEMKYITQQMKRLRKIESVFDEYDVDGENKLQWNEFLIACRELGLYNSVKKERELKKMFRREANSDGYISRKSFRKLLNKTLREIKRKYR